MLSENSRKGFTLVEILIALAIASIVMAAAYSLYITFYKQTTAQDLIIEAQQNARAGIEFMQRELTLVGHRVPSGVNAITSALPNSVTFRYVDPDTSQRWEIAYRVDLVEGAYSLRRRRCEQNQTWTVDCSTTTFDFQRVVDNLTGPTGLSFRYYDAGGVETGTLADIRFVRVSLTTVTKSPLPTTLTTQTVEVHTEVRLRNLWVLAAAADTTPPAQPTGLQVRELRLGSRVGICGRLRVRWNRGTEGDLAGYRIFYSVGGVGWNVTVPVGSLESDATYHYYTLAPSGDGALQFSPSDGSSVSTYSLTIRAYDNSYNFSTASDPPVSGNPSPSNGDFAVAGDDTTLNPSKPMAVTNFTGQDGPNEGQVRLTWSYDTANNPDVRGFRVYRSTQPFATFPLVPGGNITQIAGAPGEGFPADKTLGSSATSFTDNDTSLVGCQVYYYAIAPVNCDATLITATDAVENGDNTRYIQSDYAVTFGDGGGTAADSPSGSDTAPTDQTSPGSPTVAARAGWRRVAISVTNPADSDFSKTCLYVEKGGKAGDPTFDATKDANGCFNVVNPVVGTRGLVPDASPDTNPNGIFTNTNPVSFWHDSMTERNPATPSLAQAGAEVQTYAYKAVSFDRCGNPRTPADATAATTVATTNLCGEDPPSGEKPPAPGVPAAPMSGCEAPSSISGAPLTVNWTPVPSDVNQPSTPTNPWDLAGYRIFRSTVGGDFSSATLLNPSAPYWCEGTCSYTDNSVSEGTAYYYRIASTDCPYEKVNPSTATITNDMNNNVIHSTTTIGPFSPGRISRDEKCPGGGSCERDLHREVLTGVTVSSDNTTAPSADFKHNTVTMFLENTSAGDMTIHRVTVSWVKNSASLTKVAIGGGRSGVVQYVTNIDRASSQDITGADPYTRTLSDFNITEARIPGLTRYVPVTFEFGDIDMRDDQLLINLSVRNESTGTTTCVSYLTVSGTQQGIVVPMGPSIGSVQTSNPVASAYAVPGPVGENIVPTDGTYGPRQAAGAQDVVVSAYAIPSGDTGISEVKLYWVETALSVGTAPSSGYAAVTMTRAGGNLWQGAIPQRDTTVSAKRVWYYIVAIDGDGNWDRGPEKEEGAYTYDQKPFDKCDVTPSAPASLSLGLLDNSYVSVRWPRVTTYTNGAPINKSLDPIVYQVWRRSSVDGTYTMVYVVPDGSEGSAWVNVTQTTPATGSSYVCDPTFAPLSTYDEYCFCGDTVDTVNNDLTYYVVAKNSCSATGNLSGQTNRYRECKGATSAVIGVSPATITAGENYTVTVSDCQLSANATVDSITVGNIASTGGINYPVTLTETGSTSGLFTGAVGTTWNIGEAASKVYVRAGDLAPDTVTVSCSAGCTGTPTARQVTVNAHACENVPAAPTGLTGYVPTTGVYKDKAVILSWTASTSADRAKYRVYRKSGAGGTWASIGEVVSSASGTITYIDEAGKTNIQSNDYYYYVITIDTCSLESDPSSTVGPF